MRDLKYAVRVLVKAPVFTCTAAVTLALCIGANTAIYTVVDRVLLRPLPYPQADRLAQIVTHFDRTGYDATGQTGGVWEALNAGVQSLDLAATSGGFAPIGVNMVVGDRAENVRQQRVSAGFFRVLGVATERGREFTAEEDRPNGPAAAVLSHRLWARLFAGDAAAIGRAIILRGEPHTIVGVMPEGFTAGEAVDVWTPVRPCRACEGGGQNYAIVARLKPGVAWAAADGEVALVAQRAVDDLYRSSNRGHARQRIIPLQRAATSEIRQPILILWGAVSVVLMIGCVNLAGLLMARGAARAPEIALRMALGGRRTAILKQLLLESLVLAAAGGGAGILLGYAGSRWFSSLLADAFGVAPAGVGLDARVLSITAAAALGTGIVFGLVPALQASRVDLRTTLVEGGNASIAGAARSWPRRILVVGEVGLAVVLLVGAGLLIRTFDGLMKLRAGFDASHVVTATLSLQDARYQSADKVNRFFDDTVARMQRIGGVEGAAAALTLPYERALNVGGRWVGATPPADVIPIMNMTYITPQYFATLRIPVLRGRAFSDRDGAEAASVMIVNEAFVKKYSPEQDPIGRQIVQNPRPRTIVGVVGDIQQKAGWGGFGPVAAVPAGYVPVAQTDDAFLKIVHSWFAPSWFVRTRGPTGAIATRMQRAVQDIDPLMPFARFRTLDEVRQEAVAAQRAQAALLGALAVLAVALAGVGLYGLVASSVTERTREIGIRLALGATSRQAMIALSLPGLALAGTGVALGAVAARAVAAALRHLVWGVSLADPAIFTVAIATVLAVAACAVVAPSSRIIRLDPTRALRQG